MLGSGPLVTDCDIMQLKWFEAHHGREEKSTHKSKHLIRNCLSGPPVQIPLMIEDSRHVDDERTWFEESLGKVVACCMLGSEPLVTDCDIMQLKWFEAHHGREEKSTHKSKHLIRNCLPGPPVQIPLMIEDSRHADDKRTWFIDSLGKVVAQTSANANKAADNMDAQGFLNMFTNVKDMNDSDDDSGGELEEDDNNNDNNSSASKQPHPELKPTFVSMTDLVQTEDDLTFVRKEMKAICSNMLRRKHKAGPAGNMVLMPEADQQRKDKRIEPMGLPEQW
jgi:hypothetical protein